MGFWGLGRVLGFRDYWGLVLGSSWLAVEEIESFLRFRALLARPGPNLEHKPSPRPKVYS